MYASLSASCVVSFEYTRSHMRWDEDRSFKRSLTMIWEGQGAV